MIPNIGGDFNAMEGTLWKWTNYFSGWQPRWFILSDGVLSYYRSADDVNDGCKGSIKMAVCDVAVHSTDSVRLDLVIPGEAHFYVKAATPHERQQWLVALGSCKACRGDTAAVTAAAAAAAGLDEIPADQLKCKKSELRLYCDLLMQQVHSVKSAVSGDTAAQPPDLQRLNEATSLLSETCDTFIRTLDECVKMANATYDATSHGGGRDTTMSPSGHRSLSARAVTGPWSVGPPSAQRSMSVDRLPPVSRDRLAPRVRTCSADCEVTESPARGWPSPSAPGKGATGRLPTFFSTMAVSFTDIKLDVDGGVPTRVFLKACQSILPIFDKLNLTAFLPAKHDFEGNIKKLQQAYLSDPELYSTLQSMVLHEVLRQQHDNPSSATVALLWLKRGIEFSYVFLNGFLSSSTTDLMTISNNAYTACLKRFHGYVIRGVYVLTAKALPSRRQLIGHFSCDPADVAQPTFDICLQEDIESYTAAQEVTIKALNDFYDEQNLDFSEQV